MNSIIKDSTYFKLKYNKQNTLKLEPLLELYKGKLFCYIVKSFINDCINNFGTKIFSIKKSYIRTITNLLSGWIFSLYIDYDFSQDYLLPSNYTDTDTLKNTLYDLCKFCKVLICSCFSSSVARITSVGSTVGEPLELKNVLTPIIGNSPVCFSVS